MTFVYPCHTGGYDHSGKSSSPAGPGSALILAHSSVNCVRNFYVLIKGNYKLKDAKLGTLSPQGGWFPFGKNLPNHICIKGTSPWYAVHNLILKCF